MLALLLGGLAGPNASLAAAPMWQLKVEQHRDAPRAVVALGGLAPPESEAKVVPIRFPKERYDELKAWCEQHNFPMAAVVRGLVERFLESQ